MKIIVKLPSKDVVIIHLNIDLHGEGKIPYSECAALQKYINPEHPEFTVLHEWYVTDEVIDKSTLESRKQLMWEDVDGRTVIKKDDGWNVKLMPDQLIKKKHLDRLKAKLDAELDKEEPDTITALKLQRNLDKVKEVKITEQHSAFWADIALKNMDEDGISKPDIRAKLNDIKGK
jgi:hypothetical protein